MIRSESSRPRPGKLSRRLRLGIYASGLAGVAVSIALIAYGGWRDILDTLDLAGWMLLLVIPARIPALVLDAAGWRVLLRGVPRAGLALLTWIAVIRDAIDNLLPVARVGGELIGVRLLMLRGVSATRAGSSIMVEITITVAVQILFTLLGLAILFYYLHEGQHIARLVLIGLLLAIPAALAFFLLQHRWGLFQLLERVLTALTGREVLALLGDPAQLDLAIQQLYRQWPALLACAVWQFLGLLGSAGETWFTLYLLGHEPGIMAAILLESLAQAVQSATFVVPAGLGVQEGSYLLFGAVTGLSPDVALALALARRLRQVGLGLPALLSWQWVEGGRLRSLLRNGG